MAKDIAKIMDIDVPFNRFGWFYMVINYFSLFCNMNFKSKLIQRNESSLLTGSFNADTGSDDISKLGKLREWNYESQTKFFQGNCGNLAGASAGELFPPKISNQNQIISVFSPEMCRNVGMSYEKKVKVHGLAAMKFIGDERTMDK